MSVPFRAQLVLKILDGYSYGARVTDERAYRMRCDALLRWPKELHLVADYDSVQPQIAHDSPPPS